LRTDALYLTDIIEAADAIGEFVGRLKREAFVGDRMARSAVLQQLTVIGEAASRLSADFRHRRPDIEWADIVAFRNIAVHAYFSVDWSTVWVAATEDAPALRAKVAAILATEHPEAGWQDKASGP